MSEEDKIKLENELLLTKSKAQMINLYLDLQQKVEQLENIRKEAIEFINEWLFEAGGNGADMDYDTIVDLLNILSKGDNNVKD